MSLPNISTLLQDSTEQLSPISDSARLDAELLLCHILKKERSYLFAWDDQVLESEQINQFQQLLEQRLQHTPVAYLIGYRDFWTLQLKVTPDTLIPRPETELLVETALKIIPNDTEFSLLDLGTGTGAIALSIASECPTSKVLAVDVSEAALEVAKENAQNHNIENVNFRQSSWFENIQPQTFDLIVSNPPYIEDDDPHLIQGDVQHEPRLALTSGTDGFDDIRHIITNSLNYLKSDGTLMFEHGYQQGKKSRQLLTEAGFTDVDSYQDLAGHERITIGKKT